MITETAIEVAQTAETEAPEIVVRTTDDALPCITHICIVNVED